MSPYFYMRILESAAYRYDLGLQLLSLGQVQELYAKTAEAAVAGKSASRVLEIGCGTGNLTSELTRCGATVCAIDQNPKTLVQAAAKLTAVRSQVTLEEMAAVEIADRLEAASFDVVACAGR